MESLDQQSQNMKPVVMTAAEAGRVFDATPDEVQEYKLVMSLLRQRLAAKAGDNS